MSGYQPGEGVRGDGPATAHTFGSYCHFPSTYVPGAGMIGG
jgi:hypothetical protein